MTSSRWLHLRGETDLMLSVDLSVSCSSSSRDWVPAVCSGRSRRSVRSCLFGSHLESISSCSCYATVLRFINSSSMGLRSSPELIMKVFCSLWLLLSLVKLSPAPPASQDPPFACRGAGDPAPPQPEVKQAGTSLRCTPAWPFLKKNLFLCADLCELFGWLLGFAKWLSHSFGWLLGWC